MKIFAQKALRSNNVSGGSDPPSGLGFGAMGITAFYGSTMPDDQALDLLKQVYDAGCRHFDTAELYATGDKYNEDILGQFFQTVPRDSFSVATKYWPATPAYDYDTVKASLLKSLERLRMDSVDLYYAHRVMSLEGGLEFGRTAKRLKEEGLIKEVGLSEVSGAWLKRIHEEACPIDAVQQEWSLMTRNLEDELVPMCKELNVAVVAYSPLARNLLAKKIEKPPEDWRSTLPRYSEENLKANQKVVDQVHAIAEKYNCTAAQLSLAWIFHKAAEMGVSVIPIPGSTKLTNALSNIESVNVQITDAEDMKTLDSLAGQVAGARGNEQYTSIAIESQT